MTTSPSWFDQEKFSTLVKKVGVNSTGSGPSPITPAPARIWPDVAPPVEIKTAPLPAKVPEESVPQENKGELARVTAERDNARREYGNLREDYETLKQEATRLREASALSAPAPDDSSWEHDRMELFAQLTLRDEEIVSLQSTTVGMQDVIETFKQELIFLQEQISQEQETLESAQREMESLRAELETRQVELETRQAELEASQRETQEARDALTQSAGTTTASQTNLENLKNECSSLVQQNMFLQAQHDQLSRELSAVKAKVAAKADSVTNKPLRA